MKEPKGKLRLIQVFAGLGPMCDCLNEGGQCGGRALALFADDEHTGFALTRKCAENFHALEPYALLAEQIKNLDKKESVTIAVPKWKAGSEREWFLDMPVLMEHLGVTKKNYTYTAQSGKVLCTAL